jgi:hypothetical protein
MTTMPKDPSPSGFRSDDPAWRREALRFTREISPEILRSRVDELRLRLVGRNACSFRTFLSFREAFSTLVRKREPASVIRLGDGEGIFIAHRLFRRFEALLSYVRHLYMPHHFGKHAGDLNEESARTIGDLLIGAIAGADMVGGHSGSRIEDYVTSFESGDAEGVRAYFGWAASIVAYSDNFDVSRQHLTTWLSHFWMLRCLWPLLDDVSFIGIVNCHRDSRTVIARKFPNAEVVQYWVPPMGADDFSTADTRHYPDHFENVCASFSVPHEGAVFLVGAGPLGKVYCARLKELGAIAIDVGSNFDVWLGMRTRDWHSEEILAEHALSGGADIPSEAE